MSPGADKDLSAVGEALEPGGCDTEGWVRDAGLAASVAGSAGTLTYLLSQHMYQWYDTAQSYAPQSTALAVSAAAMTALLTMEYTLQK